jgi:hypothetical protein
MVSLKTPPPAPGAVATPFELRGVDGSMHSLDSACGRNGVVVMFICNHCPYVKAVVDKIVRDMDELRGLGVGAIAVMSNDVTAYPDDSFDNMKARRAHASVSVPLRRDAGVARVQRRLHAGPSASTATCARLPGRLNGAGATAGAAARTCQACTVARARRP